MVANLKPGILAGVQIPKLITIDLDTVTVLPVREETDIAPPALPHPLSLPIRLSTPKNSLAPGKRLRISSLLTTFLLHPLGLEKAWEPPTKYAYLAD